MDKQELQQLIKDTAYSVANSTNKEHSNFIAELRESNRKLANDFNLFKEEVRNYIKDDNLWKENFVKENKKWQDEAMPVLDAGTKALNFGSVGMGILKLIGVLGGSAASVYAFFKWIK